MKWEYDSWNRIKTITYPDGETVYYAYNLGGLLDRMWGEKGEVVTEYILDIRYTPFETKESMVYGNGTEMIYEYDILQRLSALYSWASSGMTLQDLRYTYDNVGNITRIENLTAEVNGLGGQYHYTYSYDNLYRLSRSEGYWNSSYSYGLSMDYTPDGRIERKRQYAAGNMGYTDYDRQYSYYHDQPHTLEHIDYQHFFTWDANGNMLEHHNGDGFNLRRHCWDEENRMNGMADDHSIGFYFYDAGGERTVKYTGHNQWIDVNGMPQGFASLQDPTLYTSAYLVAGRQGYTKHYYAGDQRILSKLGGGGLSNLETVPSGLQGRTEHKLEMLERQVYQTQQCLQTSYLDVDYSSILINSLYQYETVQHPETDIYFYHPDHLGSSSWITDQEGTPVQHLAYLPFGEEFVDQRTSDWNAAYKFSGKEKDAETGYNYFGARYYMSDLGIWASVDPLSDKYPSTNSYMYCAGNPIRITDPNGMEWEIDGHCYTPGSQAPEKATQSTKDKWNTMNQIYSTRNGKKAIDEMNVEGVMYNVSSETSPVGAGAYKSNGSGGTIYLNGNNSNITILGHEIFHGYQDMNGQGGASVFNEVEANLFAISVGGGDVLGTKEGNRDILYDMSLSNLIRKPEFDNESFNNVVTDFKSCATTNANGTYNNIPLRQPNQQKNLISNFYPLNPYAK